MRHPSSVRYQHQAITLLLIDPSEANCSDDWNYNILLSEKYISKGPSEKCQPLPRSPDVLRELSGTNRSSKIGAPAYSSS